MSTDTSTRQLPWDAMGGGLTVKGAKTVEAALKAKGLDYTVEVREAKTGNWVPSAAHGEGAALLAKRDTLKAPHFQALVRPMPDGSEKVLAFTRKRYTPQQNVNVFQPAEYLVSEFGASIVGAADYRGGEKSIMVVELPETIALTGRKGDRDPVTLNLVITNDHAGNAAITYALTPLRVPCTNVLPAVVKGADRVWKISHTPNAQERIDLAADAIKRALVYAQAFQAEAQGMIDHDMTDAMFSRMVQRLYPVKSSDEGVKAARRRELHAKLEAMWNGGAAIEGIEGTRWAGYNVVTEYLDHMRPVRREPGLARAEGALEGAYVRQKTNLWNLFAAA